MPRQITLARLWSTADRNRAELIGIAWEYSVDVHVFWEQPEGTHHLYELQRFVADPDGVSRLFQQHGFGRWIYEPATAQLFLPVRREEEAAVSRLLADLAEVAADGFHLEVRTVREEQLDPLARELYLHRAELPPDAEEEAKPVGCWALLVPQTPERRAATAKARDELIEGLGRLVALWERKTGRPAAVEQWLAQHEMLLALGCPRVVAKRPDGAELERCWIYRREDEPNLTLSVYGVADGPEPHRVLHGELGPIPGPVV